MTTVNWYKYLGLAARPSRRGNHRLIT